MTASSLAVGATGSVIPTFVENRCAECHDAESKKGGFDITALNLDLKDQRAFSTWVKVHDRVAAGEMPPKKADQPEPRELKRFLGGLSKDLLKSERERVTHEGRATQRRLNRYEYENALRDLLDAPWLQIRDALPEDGEAFRFNKVGDALDISHVQMARYLAAADYALRQVAAHVVERPETRLTRYYAREQRSFVKEMKSAFSTGQPERATFPTLDRAAQPEVRAGNAPVTVGAADPANRDLEGIGVVASTYEPLEPRFQNFKAPQNGHYRLRLNVFSVWVGPAKFDAAKADPTKPFRWWIPDLDDISAGRRSEPVTLYSESPPQQLRRIGAIDATPEPGAHELDAWLVAGETIRPDAARLFRSRQGPSRYRNPLAQPDGQPGVVFRWLEVEGPLYESWPTAGHRLLFGNLPIKSPAKEGSLVEVQSIQPTQDAERLLRAFVRRAYRRPVSREEEVRFMPVVAQALSTGSNFADAMIAGYTAVLCSPEFLCLEEQPGRLDDHALAARLAFFLWNSEPDAELRSLADRGQLHRSKVLHAQTDRLLADPKSRRFSDAFLDYWLDLRKVSGTAPDSTLYPDYYLDDLLSESALLETQEFFADLVRENLPASNVVASNFAMVNGRLADHYGLPPVDGVSVRKVLLPPESPRGGLMTQAAVLKVTANGTTSSPVVRGAWIMERILGQPPPPPPPGVPAVEPDIRGATTIREQLAQHRNQRSCAGCHAKIDPAGFALESFDVMGGWRDHYRATADKTTAAPGIGKGGHPFGFYQALPVDSSGELWDGRRFSDIREFKSLLLKDEAVIAQNLTRQLAVFATGAPIRFGDRAAVEEILEHTASSHYGVRDLVHGIVQSPLFLNK